MSETENKSGSRDSQKLGKSSEGKEIVLWKKIKCTSFIRM